MKSIPCCLWVGVLLLTAITDRITQGDEPPKSDADATVRAAEVLANVNVGLDVSNAQFALLDVSRSLLADNGLGIDLAPLEAALRTQLDLDENTGLVVTTVPEESVGAKAGLKVHDVVVEVANQKVGEAAKLTELLTAADGKSVRLRVLRGGKAIDLEVMPQKPAFMARIGGKHLWTTLLPHEDHYRIGVTLAEADDTLRAHLRLATGEGLVVTDLVEGGAAGQAGVLVHDVLIVLDGKRLTTVEAINAQIQEIKEKKVELRLLRLGKEMTLQVAPRRVKEAAAVDHPLVYWDTKNCQSCHSNAHENAHNLTAAKWFISPRSAWTDGHTNKLYFYEKFAGVHRQNDAATGPQQQIDTLKTQLSEVQKTLAALEAALAPTEPKSDDQKK